MRKILKKSSKSIIYQATIDEITDIFPPISLPTVPYIIVKQIKGGNVQAKQESDVTRTISQLRDNDGNRISPAWYYLQDNYILMEFIRGKTFKQLLNEKKITCKELLDRGKSVIQVLASNGIIHEDLNMSNLIIDDNGNVKLIDFGSMDVGSQEREVSSDKLSRAHYSQERYITMQKYMLSSMCQVFIESQYH